MMQIIKLVKYQLKVFFMGTGPVLPVITTAVFLYFMYHQKPVDAISTFLITGIFVFPIMMWVGITVTDQEHKEIEETLYLKMNSAVGYHSGKLFFPVVVALLLTVVCVIFPLIVNLLNGGKLFDTALTAGDVFGAVLIIGSSAICGAILGNLHHPRVIRNRQLAYAVLALVCVLSFAKIGIIQKVPLLKYILWIVPDVMYPSNVFAGAEHFDIARSAGVCFLFLLYSCVYGVLKSVICQKKKFS